MPRTKRYPMTSFRRVRLSFERLEDRTLLDGTPITGPQRLAILDGLQGLVDWGTALGNHNQVAQAISLVDRSVGQAMDLAGTIRQGLHDRIAAASIPNTDAMLATLRGLSATYGNLQVMVNPVSVSGGFDEAQNEFRFTLTFQATRTSTAALNFGANAADLGLSVDPAPTVSVEANFNFQFSFGYDLTQGLSPAQAFFIRSPSVTAGLTVNVADLNFAARLGFLNLGVENGSVNLAGNVAIGVTNPDGDSRGNITLAEIQGTSIGALVNLTPTGSLAGTLPVSATLGGFAPAGATISVAASNVFSGAAPTVTTNAQFGEILNFNRLTPANALGLLNQLGGWLGEFRSSSLFAVAVPFTQGKTFGDLYNFATAYNTRLTSQLIDVATGNPNFASAQQLAGRLATILGLDPSVINANYDPATKNLTYHVMFDHALASVQAPINLGVHLGALGGITTTANVTLNATVNLEFTFGVTLTPLVGDETLADKFFIRSARAGGSATLSAANIAATARFGFLEISATGGSASATGGLAFQLKDPVSGTPGGTIRLPQLLFAIVNNPSSVVVTPPSFTGSANLTLPNITVGGNFLGVLAGNPTITLEAPDLSNVSLAGLIEPPSNGRLSGDASFTLAVDEGLTSPVAVLVTAASTATNTNIDDLVTDINAALVTAGIGNKVSALRDGNRIVLARAGSGSLVSLAVATVGGTAAAELGLSALQTAATQVQVAFNSAMEPLLNFQTISAANISAALAGLATYLSTLSSFSILGQRLPLINRSVSELLGYANNFVQTVTNFRNNPADSVQVLANRLLAALPQNLSPAVTVSFTAQRILRFNVSFSPSFNQTLPMDFDIGSLADMIGGEVGQRLTGIRSLVGGTGNLSVTAGATLNLHLGVDLNDPFAPTPVVFDSTGLSLTARVVGTNLGFRIGIGPLGLFVVGGTAALDADGMPGTTPPASFTIGLMPAPNGYYTLGELNTGIVTANLTGAVNITLPLFFPLETTPLGGSSPGNHLVVGITDLNNIAGTVSIITPDFREAFTQSDFLNNLGIIVSGLDALLGMFQEAFRSRVFSTLPLVGGNLRNAANFIEQFRTTVIQKINDAPNRAAATIKQKVFEAFGPGTGGLNVLARLDCGAGVPTIDDVQLTLVTTTGSESAQFNVCLKKTVTFATGIGFDIGLPVLGLDVQGDVNVSLGFTMRLGFGVNRNHGFYFDTSGAQPEFSVALNASVPGFNANGRLLFLILNARDHPTQSTGFNTTFGVNITDPNNDGKLTLAELTSGAPLSQIVDARLTTTVRVSLNLTASFPDATLPHFGTVSFPSLSTHFLLTWGFTDARLGEVLSQLGSRPTLEFRDVTLHLGSFFTKLVGPILNVINKVLAPIKPITDILTSCIPVISHLRGCTSLVDIGRAFGYGQAADFIAVASQVINFATRLQGLGSPNVGINFGHFSLGSSDPRNMSSLANVNPTPMGGGGGDPYGQVPAGEARNLMTSMRDTQGGGLQFPLFQQPMSAFRLLLGQDVSLFTFQMPTLRVGFSYSQLFRIPAFPIVGVRISGSISAEANFKFGFDTFGLRKFVQNGYSNITHIFEGLFIDKAATGVRLTGSLTAAAELNIVVARAGVGGGIFATVNLGLNDPDRDGKVRIHELVANFNRGPLCVFDLNGELTAKLFAYLQIGFCPFCVKKRWDIGSFVLLRFSASCPPGTPQGNPVLGQMIGSQLNLNIGPRASLRGATNIVDGDEVFTVRRGSSANQVIVSAFGHNQTFNGVTSIIADGGAGNDQIEIDDALNLPVTLRGGSGDDKLNAGGGAALLEGGDGNDYLTGSAVGDTLRGGNHDDTLVGDRGNDLLEGEGGDDLLEGGDGNDTLRGGEGEDELNGGADNDRLEGGNADDQMDGGAGNDTLIGGLGQDRLEGGAGNDSLEGNEGNDHLLGDANDDTLRGGIGNDTLEGGDGADQLFGEAGLDSLTGDAGNDRLEGGTENDTLRGGANDDILDGGAGDDQMFGDAGHDNLDGGAGNDLLDGGAGNDILVGRDGNDTLRGGDGTDQLRGGVGMDQLAGDGDNDFLQGDEENDTLDGGAGHDTLFGNAGNDVLRGQEGNDSLEGADGGDTLSGGAGNDTLIGGIGGDLLQGDEGDDIVLGDAGTVAANGLSGQTNAAGGTGNDTIYGGGGNDTLFGGGGADLIYGDPAGGQGHNVLIGDQGSFTATLIVSRTSGEPGSGGNDTIFGAMGTDIILGGEGLDSLTGDGGHDVLVGDYGQVTRSGAVITRVETFDVNLGGNDVLDGGAGDDLLVGGFGGDTVRGGEGHDVILGDNGAIVGADGSAQQHTIFSSDVAFGGADSLDAGAGNNIVIGGVLGDNLTSGVGNDVLVGDHATITRNAAGAILRVTSTFENVGGADVLDGGNGHNTLIGGLGADRLTTGDGNDILLGDNGVAVGDDGTQQAFAIFTTQPELGGIDTIDAGAGDDFLLGGALGDNLTAGAGNDVAVGDHALIARNAAGAVLRVTSTFESIGGNDTIATSAGFDILIGGFGADQLTAGDDADILLGDHGIIAGADGSPQQHTIFSTATEFGAADLLDGGSGDDSMIGGVGNDTLAGGLGADILVGDHGRITRNGATGAALRTATIVEGDGGNDLLESHEGDDTLLGGFGSDTLRGGDGADVLMGDNGVVVGADTTQAFMVFTTSSTLGDTDTLEGGLGADILVGGTSSDHLTGGGGDDVLVGDHASIARSSAGAAIRTTTIVENEGDADFLDGQDGNDIVIGGFAGDDLRGGADNDTVLGDNGVVVGNDGSAQAFMIFTTSPTLGGIDLLDGGAGNDILIGGTLGDYVVGGAGNDMILGDHAEILRSNTGVVLRISTTFEDNGGDDLLDGEDGNDSIFAGLGADTISGSAGNDVLWGDNAVMAFADNSPHAHTTFTTSPALGGADLILGGLGDDTIVAGTASDRVFGEAGNDVVVADHARVIRTPTGIIEQVMTIFPDLGGNDTLEGNAGNDVLIGGMGQDTIVGHTGNDVIIGDNGLVFYINDGTIATLDLARSQHPTLGGNDTLQGEEGDDTIYGGTGQDTILGGSGNDQLFGDHGLTNWTLPANRNFLSVFPGVEDAGGADSIRGDTGNDTILGQQGADLLLGDEDDDDLIGGHNVAGGADGNDTIDGGQGNDVLAGDNASIIRRDDTLTPLHRLLVAGRLYNATGAPAVTSSSQRSPYDVVGRDVVLFDHSTTASPTTYGADSLAGGAGHDRIFGQMGNDTIQGDASVTVIVSPTRASVGSGFDGDDYIEGGGGNDLIFGNRGQDDVIGGSSSLFGLSTPAQRPDGSDIIFGGTGQDIFDGTGQNIARNSLGDQTPEGHARDGDMILGDNGNIYRVVAYNAMSEVFFPVFNYDRYSGFLWVVPRTFGLLDYTPGSGGESDLGAGDLIRSEAGDDTIHGMTGNDTLYGDGQDDDLIGGVGDDWISGGTGSDGILGDDGKIMTNRNDLTEPMHGVDTTTVEEYRITTDSVLRTYLHPSGRLTKAVDLEPFSVGGNDMLYGGLGDDSIHGGAGMDGLSGAEALPGFYANPGSTPRLVFNDETGTFEGFDVNNPLVKIPNHPLNFEAFTNPQDPEGSAVFDGEDVLFGDEGNDWLVGGTFVDRLYGGRGRDLLNLDDNLESSGLEDYPFDYPDTAFGGGGQDTLLGNSYNDRLVDWWGEFDFYAVPFPETEEVITSWYIEEYELFLYALSKSDGADQTRFPPGTAQRNGEPFGELGLFIPTDPDFDEQTGGFSQPFGGGIGSDLVATLLATDLPPIRSESAGQNQPAAGSAAPAATNTASVDVSWVPTPPKPLDLTALSETTSRRKALDRGLVDEIARTWLAE